MLATVDWPSAALWLARLLLLGTVWFGVLWGLLMMVREPARRVTLCAIALLGGLAIPLFLAVPTIREVSVAPGFQLNLARAADWIPEQSQPKSPVRSRSLEEVRNLPQVPQPRSAAPASLFEGLWMPVPDEGAVSEEPPASVRPVISTSPGQPVSIDAPSYRTLWISITLIVVVSVYGVGVLALGAWYVVGLIGLGLLIRRGRAPSPELASQWREVCDRGECRASLLVSDSIAQPIACWMGHAYVILPADWSRAADERLAWALAHEAEHICQQDFWSWQAANLARVLFWCQPLVWWLRRELRLAQDHLADAAAARAPHAAVEYAEFLTKSARVGAGRVPLIGLGLFGGRSDLYRRVAMLLKRDRPLERRAPRWWSVSLILAGIAMLVATSTIRVVAEPPASPKQTQREAASNARPEKAAPAPGYVRDGGEKKEPLPTAIDLTSPPPSSFNSSIGFLDSANSSLLGPSSTSTAPASSGGGGEASPAKPGPAPASVQKLTIDKGGVEPEPGVFLSLVSLMDASGNLWSTDGNRIDPAMLGGFGEGSSGFGGAMASPGGMPMGGSPGYGPPGGYGSNNMPADHRARTATIHVRRPGPSGIQTSVDGQAANVSTSQLTEPKVRQVLLTAYWPEEQMTGSVGVRFASKTIARELVATEPKGEAFQNKEGETEARVGPWTDEGELRTSVRLDQARPNDPRFVVTAVARDVDGALHTGRLEQRSQPGPGGPGGGYDSPYGGAMPGMGMGGVPLTEWYMVFPHLPVSRIQEIRITWHPYGWVIFRNVSLEVDHKSTPTAELYLDKSAPPVLPKGEGANNPTGTDPAAPPYRPSNGPGFHPPGAAPSAQPRTSLRRSGERPDGINIPIRVVPDSDAAKLEPDDLVTLFVTFQRDGKRVTEPLVNGGRVVATHLKLPQDWTAHVVQVNQEEADIVNLAQRIGTVTMLAETEGASPQEPNKSLKKELETIAGQTAEATVLR